ncbi:MAG: Tn3 family transposase [Thermoleophilaceae bacterium]
MHGHDRLRDPICDRRPATDPDPQHRSDIIFALFDLLGLRFAPRLARLADTRLWHDGHISDTPAADATSDPRPRTAPPAPAHTPTAPTSRHTTSTPTTRRQAQPRPAPPRRIPST